MTVVPSRFLPFRLPPPIPPLLRLGTEVAVFVRLGLLVPMAVVSQAMGEPLSGMTLLATAYYAALTALLFHADLHRTRAWLLFRSLGVSRLTISLCAIVPALAIEGAVHLLLRR